MCLLFPCDLCVISSLWTRILVNSAELYPRPCIVRRKVCLNRGFSGKKYGALSLFCSLYLGTLPVIPLVQSLNTVRNCCGELSPVQGSGTFLTHCSNWQLNTGGLNVEKAIHAEMLSSASPQMQLYTGLEVSIPQESRRSLALRVSEVLVATQ